MVKFLASLPEVDINCKTCGGDTPLMYACQRGDLYLVVECLNLQMDPLVHNVIGMTAKDYAHPY